MALMSGLHSGNLLICETHVQSSMYLHLWVEVHNLECVLWVVMTFLPRLETQCIFTYMYTNVYTENVHDSYYA